MSHNPLQFLDIPRQDPEKDPVRKRVRHFGDTARIEVPARDLDTVRGQLEPLRESLAAVGFGRVDLVELRSGALNDALRVIG